MEHFWQLSQSAAHFAVDRHLRYSLSLISSGNNLCIGGQVCGQRGRPDWDLGWSIVEAAARGGYHSGSPVD
jgi:hypothetical protein